MASLRADLLPPRLRGVQRMRELARRSWTRFAPTKSQRRAATRMLGPAPRGGRAARRRRPARPLRRSGTPTARTRAAGKPNPQTRERYALEFGFHHPCAREAAFYDDAQAAGGKLVGVGLFDETARAISAAFFFLRPGYARFSLGTANVVALLADARAAGRPHVYLGFVSSAAARPSVQGHAFAPPRVAAQPPRPPRRSTVAIARPHF
jgi:arginyl-tRNA--protein-N-Asp/Glu arginylyltransferase